MRLSVLVTAVSLSVIGLAVADDVRAAVKRETNIPAQQLGSALQALAKDRNFQVVYVSEEVNDRRTAGVVGEFTPEEALQRLLEGTGLTYRFVDEKTVAIEPIKPAATGKQPHPRTSETPQPNADDNTEKSNRSGLRLAQTDRETSAGAAPITTNGSGAAGQTPASGQLEEIVVTAQKRTERIQDVPLSVNALSVDRLANYGATQLSDYAATIPGLQVDGAGAPGFQTVTLRGITTGNLFGSMTAAIYVDGIPTGSSSSYAYGASFGLDLLPYDLDRVEVLKGPQGTLYGASSMGGLLKYVLSTPDLHKNSFRAGADVSSVDGGSGAGYGFRGYANFAVIPGELGVSVSAAHTHIPGFIANVVDGTHAINDGTQDSARAALLWRPDERLSVKLSALMNQSDFNSLAEVPLTAAGQPVYGNFTTRLFDPAGLKTRTMLYSADIGYDFGWATLTSVTGYSHADNEWFSDATVYPFFASTGDRVPAKDAPGLRKFSQEVRLASPEHQPFQWVLGGFYTNEHAALYEHIQALDSVTGQPDPTYDPFDNILRSSRFQESAIFGNATYELSSSWDVNAGIRYSHNKQTVETVGLGTNGTGGYLFGGTPSFSTPVYNSSESVFTYSGSTRYHFSPDAMIYARVATGYRPGGSNAGVAGAPNTFSADTLVNYELGMKSELLDKRLLLNVDAFYIDWHNIQLGQYTSAHLIYTGNAATAVSDGVELSTEYALTSELRLGANVVYDNARLTANAPGVGGSDGDRLPLSAQWSGAVTGDWTHPLVGSYALTAGFVWRYVGDRNADFPDHLIAGDGNYLHLASYDTLDLSLGVRNDRLTVRLYGKNVTNEYAYLRYYAPLATVLQPRTVGLSVDVSL